ncbi:MAG: hypothetical protein ACD_28C00165G0001 [uncultured bacterium]|nr:MAG: hypothetical protein ACD_28C00165G0001 [uncultured bacterium]
MDGLLARDEGLIVLFCLGQGLVTRLKTVAGGPIIRILLEGNNMKKLLMCMACMILIQIYPTMAGGLGWKIREFPNLLPSASEAPKECLETLRNFLHFLSKDQGNLFNDADAQARFLTKGLRRDMKVRSAVSNREDREHPKEIGTPAGNEVIIGFWEYPSRFSILGSRVYQERAVVDVLYTWGKGKNYEGEKVPVTFIFRMEDQLWRLEDIYCFRGGYNDSCSLSQELRETRYHGE